MIWVGVLVAVVVAVVLVLAVIDWFQPRHAIRRNYPVIGRQVAGVDQLLCKDRIEFLSESRLNALHVAAVDPSGEATMIPSVR